MTRLKNKVAIVSGGALGMGAEHVRTFVREGAKVVFGDVLDEAGQALAEELGPDAVFQHLDVASESDWNAIVDRALTEFGALHILVNNAGIYAAGPLEPGSLNAWNRSIAVNLTGSYLGIVAARDALVASAPSSIVNISSINGLVGSPEAHGYVASKFGLRGLTKSVADELGPLGVRANSVHPGVIRTQMMEGIDLELLSIPLGRVGESDEVSRLVVFLSSEESSFCTGGEFVIDGGQTSGTGYIDD